MKNMSDWQKVLFIIGVGLFIGMAASHSLTLVAGCGPWCGDGGGVWPLLVLPLL